MHNRRYFFAFFGLLRQAWGGPRLIIYWSDIAWFHTMCLSQGNNGGILVTLYLDLSLHVICGRLFKLQLFHLKEKLWIQANVREEIPLWSDNYYLALFHEKYWNEEGVGFSLMPEASTRKWLKRSVHAYHVNMDSHCPVPCSIYSSVVVSVIYTPWFHVFCPIYSAHTTSFKSILFQTCNQAFFSQPGF